MLRDATTHVLQGAIASVVLALSACTGRIDPLRGSPESTSSIGPSGGKGAPGSPGSGLGGPGSAGSTSGAADPCGAVEIDPGPTFLRRLNRFEYDNTVRDLLGDTSSPASAFP